MRLVILIIPQHEIILNQVVQEVVLQIMEGIDIVMLQELIVLLMVELEVHVIMEPMQPMAVSVVVVLVITIVWVVQAVAMKEAQAQVVIQITMA